MVAIARCVAPAMPQGSTNVRDLRRRARVRRRRARPIPAVPVMPCIPIERRTIHAVHRYGLVRVYPGFSRDYFVWYAGRALWGYRAGD